MEAVKSIEQGVEVHNPFKKCNRSYFMNNGMVPENNRFN
jgi:hypothetical protein